MHRVTKPIVLGVAALFGVGLISAAAPDRHGDAVGKAVVAAKLLVGEARGDAVSLVASANGEARSEVAKADAKADKAARALEKAARATDKAADKAAKTNGDAHGDAVSMVARSDATAAHTTGAKKVNHGGAVSAAAHAGK
jgi:vacuolar-type H+-ATPase subunit H